MFLRGKEYKRADIHELYGGSSQSGICPSRQKKVIFLFTGTTGEQYGYEDGWEGPLFHYTGEGQEGDMEFSRGNKAIRDHVIDGRELHLFRQTRKGHVAYIGQMVCKDYAIRRGRDRNGNERDIIVFDLVPVEFDTPESSADPELEHVLESIDDLSLQELRQKAVDKAVSTADAKERRTKYYVRSKAIKLYALARAGGVCEGCGQPAPFVRLDETPYLEVHHIKKLADEGPDDPKWVIALCPNCHRRAHHGIDASEFNDQLAENAGKLEGR